MTEQRMMTPLERAEATFRLIWDRAPKADNPFDQAAMRGLEAGHAEDRRALLAEREWQIAELVTDARREQRQFDEKDLIEGVSASAREAVARWLLAETPENIDEMTLAALTLSWPNDDYQAIEAAGRGIRDKEYIWRRNEMRAALAALRTKAGID